MFRKLLDAVGITHKKEANTPDPIITSEYIGNTVAPRVTPTIAAPIYKEEVNETSIPDKYEREPSTERQREINAELMRRYHSDPLFKKFWQARGRENYWRKKDSKNKLTIKKLRKELRQLKKTVGVQPQ